MPRTSATEHSQKLSAKLGTKPLIVSAGMPRSGSTLLFNILREILSIRWPDQVSAGWHGDIFELPEGSIYLVKTHNLDQYYRFRAEHIFYSYRDVRVAAISSMKKFNVNPSICKIRNDIKEYLVAKKFSDHIIKYEDLVSKPAWPIQQIARSLEISVDPEEIIEKTFNLQPPKEISGAYSKETLLHKGHFTNTKDDEWRGLLPEGLKKEINDEFSWWFEECGYPIS